MEKTLLKNPLSIALIAILSVELLSLLTINLPALHTAAFFVVLLLVAGLTLWKTELGLYAILLELFIGGKGYLLSFEIGEFTLSLRIALFVAVLIIWLIKNFGQLPNHFIKNLRFYFPYGLLCIFIILAMAQGLIQNERLLVALDANAWLFFAALPLFITELKYERINVVIKILTAALLYLGLKTAILLVVFGQGNTFIAQYLYNWVRDTGVGEITHVTGSVFRIFFQSQMFALAGFFVLLTYFFFNQAELLKKHKWVWLSAIYLSSFAVIISQSRSFWLGLLGGIIVLFFAFLILLKVKIKQAILILGIIALMILSQVMLIQVLTGNFAGLAVKDRFVGEGATAAGTARLNQLRPISQAIISQPLLGYGFGKTLTYNSTDPRILKNNPSGEYTTYAFEWGYLDIWLKLGIFGLFAYSLVLGQLFGLGLKKITPLKVALLTGLIAVLITNIFSPYLNHPLGIGYILLTAVLLKNEA